MNLKSHTKREISEYLGKEKPVWALHTANSGNDDVLCGEWGTTEEQIWSQILSHHELEERPEDWMLEEITPEHCEAFGLCIYLSYQLPCKSPFDDIEFEEREVSLIKKKSSGGQCGRAFKVQKMYQCQTSGEFFVYKRTVSPVSPGRTTIDVSGPWGTKKEADERFSWAEINRRD